MKTIASMDVSSVKSIRKMSGLSQRKFAAKYGIPVSTVEAWERGLREPTSYLLALLAFRVAYDAGASGTELLALMHNSLDNESGGKESV